MTDYIENHILHDSHSFFLTSDYDSIQSLDFRHVWYFEPILEDKVLFVAYLLATSPMFLHEFVAFGTIQSLVVCDPQLFNQLFPL